VSAINDSLYQWIYMIADERARKRYIFLITWFLLVQNWKQNGLGPHFRAAPPLDPSCSETMDPPLMIYFFLLRLVVSCKKKIVSLMFVSFFCLFIDDFFGFVSFRFVSFLLYLVSFLLCLVSFRFVSFRFCFVSCFTITPLK